MKIAIVGGGFTGLTAAYDLIKAGHKVSVFEKDKFLGGLASGIKIGDWYVDRFYHHIFQTDKEILKLYYELRVKNIWVWQKGDSPIFYQGRIYPFTSSQDLLKFPLISLGQKIKTGLAFLNLKFSRNYQRFTNINAQSWLKKHMGEKVWRIVWRPLIQKKFGRHAKDLSMVWMWARIFKRSAFLGYPQGGFQILADKLGQEIKTRGGEIILGQEIKKISQLKKFDRIIFTTATPVFERVCQVKIASDEKAPYLASLAFLIQLKKPLTQGVYWLNINDMSLPFLALVEQTNLINKKHYANKHLIYLGTYLDINAPDFKLSKNKLFKKWIQHLVKINPQFKNQWVEKYWLFKEKYAQPVFRTGFKPKESFTTCLPHVYLANMTHIYPWDRGVNYAIKLGKKLAKVVS